MDDRTDRPLDAVDIFRDSVAPSFATSADDPATRALFDDIIGEIINYHNDDLAILIADLAADVARYRTLYFEALTLNNSVAAENRRLRANKIAEQEITRAAQA